MTAQNAVTLLRSEGLVYTSPGRGTFVAPDGPERARKVGEATVHSPAFVAISARLDELTNAVQDLSNRLAWLEARQDVQRPPGEEES
jgi:DNA-binding GntR family transcriptional regulator